MNRTKLFTTGLALALCGVAMAQLPPSGMVDGSANPNASDRQQEVLREIRDLEDKRRAELERQALVERFNTAVKPRKWHYADFDQVVTHGKSPMSAQVLELISQSYYAADIAYYLGKHPDQAMTISRMPKPAATQAVKTIESTLIARGV